MKAEPIPPVCSDMLCLEEQQERVNISAAELSHLYMLDSIRGFGPHKFRSLYLQGIQPNELIQNPMAWPGASKQDIEFRNQLQNLDPKLQRTCFERALVQISTASQCGAHILTYRHSHYPQSVFSSNNPIPVLYARGSTDILLNSKAVACVGSRAIKEPYAALQRTFTMFAAQKGFAIVSGFALGADTIAHRGAAIEGTGVTICVMPSGLDKPFPPENRGLLDELYQSALAVFVSEFPFGTRVSSLNLRKRNKLIVAFSQGVVIAQAAIDGGSMNAYRCARESRKPIATFLPDATHDTSGNRLMQGNLSSTDAMFPIFPTLVRYEKWLRELATQSPCHNTPENMRIQTNSESLPTMAEQGSGDIRTVMGAMQRSGRVAK